MKPVHFDPNTDLAPAPFDDRVCRPARQLKAAGLEWQPHVGCFVWDPEHCIEQDSPFPNRIYFVLSLPRFIEIFGDIEKMAEKLIWLPTWHQARLLCRQLGVPDGAISNLWQNDEAPAPGEELLGLYGILMDTLVDKNYAAFTGPAGRLDKISVAALIGRMGDIRNWPDNLTAGVLRVYRQFVGDYLNILRQKENKPLSWFPQFLSIDPELADGMRHFYSDYQHITKQFYQLNRKLDQLHAIEGGSQSKQYQEKIDEIFQLCAE